MMATLAEMPAMSIVLAMISKSTSSEKGSKSSADKPTIDH